MKRLFGLVGALSLVLGCWTLVQARPGGLPGQDKKPDAGQQGGQASGEGQAYAAIQNELDPERKIQMITDFEKKFPTSAGLPYVYLLAADTYRQKGDVPHVIEYGEKSLKIKSDNPVALILVASLLPEPQSLQGNELDKEKKLSEAEDYATRAIKLVDQLPRQQGMTDDQYKKSKNSLTSWAHSSLGMVHLQRSGMSLNGLDADELGKAETEYQAAISLSEPPNPGDYFRLGEAFKGHGKIDDAIAAFSKASELDQSGGIKTLADKAAEDLKKKKAAEKPAAKQ